MNLEDIQRDIGAVSDEALASELLQAYEELRTRHFRRDFRPGQLEAGRFAEAAFRVLQHLATGEHTAVGKSLPKVPALMQTLQDADGTTVHESVRVHIPRALATVYNVRNRRDVGHIASDVDANVMDAELVLAVCTWVLAEFVRLVYQCDAEEAQACVERIIERKAPLVQVIGGAPFVIATNLTVAEELLVLIYNNDADEVTLADLDSWTLGSISRRVISARLSELENRDRFVRRVAGRICLTAPGATAAERIFQAATA